MIDNNLDSKRFSCLKNKADSASSIFLLTSGDGAVGVIVQSLYLYQNWVSVSVHICTTSTVSYLHLLTWSQAHVRTANAFTTVDFSGYCTKAVLQPTDAALTQFINKYWDIILPTATFTVCVPH